MVRRRLVLAGLMLAPSAAVMLSGCGSSDTFGRALLAYRYKLIAEVETPQGIKSGYSVIQVQWSQAGSIYGSQGSAGFDVKGEAVAVDVAPNQTMFVLLRSPTDPDWAAYAASVVPTDTPITPGVRDRATRMADEARDNEALLADRGIYNLWGGEVPKERAQYLPYMVRFRDIRDPKSVELVSPDDLAKSFGKGFKLKSLTLQITDEPVTVGVEKRLGWLESVGKSRGTLIPKPPRLLRDAKPVQLIAPSDFSTELYK